MMNQSFLLWRLQKIDTSIDQIQSRIKEIEAVINSNQSVAESSKRIDEAEKNLKKAHSSLKTVEEMAVAQRLKIEIDEASLYSGRIRSPKELKDLQNEVASLKRYFSELEENQFDQMVQFEQAEKDLLATRKNHEIVMAQFSSQSAALIGEKNNLAVRLENLQEERKPALLSIEPNSLSLYQQLRDQKRGVAVSTVEDSACTVCGADLRPAERQAARSPHTTVFCSSCGRILYAG
jgi:predicted  nucleic acid-binding Zn-ribbon protein